ncbi:MAG: hypothetical protein HYS08_10440 [Chlamydiae bacterium]|nr:hypothetical protein [Chlamydiota bacterium]MBI3266544.1 hypothetical protein [Chlamydiota bacterium]
MKSYRTLWSLALGLLLAGSLSYGAVTCPMCKAEVPSSTKPVVATLTETMKCSMCGTEMKAGSEVSKMTCPACKAEIALCDMCAKGGDKAAE